MIRRITSRLRSSVALVNPIQSTECAIGCEWRHFSASTEAVAVDLPSNVVVDDMDAFFGDMRFERTEPMVETPESFLKVPVWELDRGLVGDSVVDLERSVWAEPLRTDIVHRVVEWQRARRRTTLYETKRRDTISGGGRKPRPQKGLGQSRQGSIRNPQWRGGIKAHGPVHRDWSHKLNKKIRRMGMRVVLSSKLRDGRLFVVDSIPEGLEKTQAVEATLNALDTRRPDVLLLDHATVFVAGDEELGNRPEFERAGRSLLRLRPIRQIHANVYDLVRAQNLVVTTTAIQELTDRLKK